MYGLQRGCAASAAQTVTLQNHATKSLMRFQPNRSHANEQGWLQGYVIGGGVEANLTNSCWSMLRFDQLESVNVEV